MALPVDLVLVRHGESEGNIASALSKQGDDRHYTPEFRNRHSSTWRLSDRGIEQARSAGSWVARHISPRFDRYITSDYFRARETAAYLSLSKAQWHTDFYLREREWGDLDTLTHEEHMSLHAETMAKRKVDAFYWSPPGGESMAHLCNRLKWVLDTLHRECADKQVIMVCHGEVMWGFRVLIERITADRYLDLDRSTDQRHRIHNGQVLHYTRKDPDSGEVARYAGWLRSVCPWGEASKQWSWEKITRQPLSNDDLLRSVERVPRMIAD